MGLLNMNTRKLELKVAVLVLPYLVSWTVLAEGNRFSDRRINLESEEPSRWKTPSFYSRQENNEVANSIVESVSSESHQCGAPSENGGAPNLRAARPLVLPPITESFQQRRRLEEKFPGILQAEVNSARGSATITTGKSGK